MEYEQFEDDFVVASGSPDFRSELAAQLAELAPEVIADGKVDVAKLQELLGEDVADSSERFGLFWPGKKNALRVAQAPTTATLRPDIENSKDWDTTQNVFIEGDNLEVLKILQKHYHNKIKMIYIDPPYNTGKDFVYPDNFKEGLDSYLEWTRQVNEEGKKLSSNSETEGRYHSNWLNMMYPRLKLARNLLTDDGVIFISIDDNEQDNLKKLCCEIFGEANFLGQFVWNTKNAARGVPPRTMLMSNHEYVLAFARNQDELKFQGIERSEEDFSNPDNDPRGLWRSESMKATGAQNNYFTIVNPENNQEFSANWAFSATRVAEMIDEKLVIFPKGNTGTPRQKKFINTYINDKKAFVTSLGWYSTETATKALMDLFGGAKVFDFPKPVPLLRFLIKQATQSNDLVLDFFAGSSATAHSVISQSIEDGENRRFIMVQLPEPTPEDSEARKLGYETIADISRERIRRAGAAIVAERDGQLDSGNKSLDVGFRSYKLNASNFAKWQVTSDVEAGKLGEHLLSLRGSADDDATLDDLLTEVLLKQGYSLTEHISKVDVAGLELHSVGDGLVLAYLNEHVKPTLDQFRAVVDAGPSRLIVLEDAYQGDDQLKTNLEQLCKSKSVELWRA